MNAKQPRRVVTEAEMQAEKSLIGFGLLQPKRALELDVATHHFAMPQWAKAWGAICEMAADGEAVDEVAVAARLEAEGMQVLGELAEAAVQPAMLPEQYADIVRDG